ncbi:MAG TPA: type II toxin-antitoxin system VapC family toxin [Candidatus Baltobacteraceae bacterium]
MIGFLLGTTAISELRKPKPNAGFQAWLAAQADHRLFVSALTIGELRVGIALLEESPRRAELDRWLSHGIVPRFGSRILPFDTHAAIVWGEAVARARRRTLHLPFVDSQIAAIARANGLAIVTRNERDFPAEPFEGLLEVLNPWS